MNIGIILIIICILVVMGIGILGFTGALSAPDIECLTETAKNYCLVNSLEFNRISGFMSMTNDFYCIDTTYKNERLGTRGKIKTFYFLHSEIQNCTKKGWLI